MTTPVDTAIPPEYDWDAELSGAKPEMRDTNTMPRTGTGTARTPTGARRGGVRATKRLDNLQTILSQQMFQAGAMIGVGLPVTGYYVASESDNFTRAIVTLARRKTEWIEALEHVADVMPGITIGRTVLGIACAMGTDRFHRSDGQSGMDPDKRAAMLLGVTAAYYEVYKEGNASTSGVYSPPPHPKFQPVA